ncbi:MAG: hypothetical protein F6J89_23675, partial [Symploca sp. SIO1C4]|nr:hypothetical protein [Symploca sp. SIO1C4]
MNKPASASSLNSNLVSRKFKRPSAMALAITISLTGLLSAACQDTTNSSTTGEGGLKLGT